MGISSDGLLIFGINFGEDFPHEVMSKIKKVLDEEWDPEHYEDYEDEFEGESILGVIDELIRIEAGIPEWQPDDPDGTARWAKIKEAEENYPISVEQHCSYNYPMTIISIPGHKHRAWQGDAKVIDHRALEVSPVKIAAMKAWFEKWELPWSEPKWLLCSMYG